MTSYVRIPIREEEHAKLLRLQEQLTGKIESYLTRPSLSDVIRYLLDQQESTMYPKMKINAFYGATVYADGGNKIGTLAHRTQVEVIEPFTKPSNHKGEFVKVTDGEMTGHVHASNVIETDAVE